MLVFNFKDDHSINLSHSLSMHHKLLGYMLKYHNQTNISCKALNSLNNSINKSGSYDHSKTQQAKC